MVLPKTSLISFSAAKGHYQVILAAQTQEGMNRDRTSATCATCAPCTISLVPQVAKTSGTEVPNSLDTNRARCRKIQMVKNNYLSYVLLIFVTSTSNYLELRLLYFSTSYVESCSIYLWIHAKSTGSWPPHSCSLIYTKQKLNDLGIATGR